MCFLYFTGDNFVLVEMHPYRLHERIGAADPRCICMTAAGIRVDDSSGVRVTQSENCSRTSGKVGAERHILTRFKFCTQPYELRTNSSLCVTS